MTSDVDKQGQGEPTPLLPHLDGSLFHFLIPSTTIFEEGHPCERNLRGAFFWMHGLPPRHY